MYPEFIPIYVGLVVIVVLLIINIILLVKRTSSTKVIKKKEKPIDNSVNTMDGVVFCRNCATQYDASQRCCPKCGTPR